MLIRRMNVDELVIPALKETQKLIFLFAECYVLDSLCKE